MYCSNFGHCVFDPPPPSRDLGTTYDIHLRLIGKRVVDFLLVLIELFSLGITAEALRAKIDIGVLKAGGSVCAKFSRRRDIPSPRPPFLHG